MAFSYMQASITNWAFAILFLLPGLCLGYALDSHYQLRFGLSLSTCFDWDESHLIASGDWNLDANGSTHAEMQPFRKRNKINWHAFGHSDKRFNELWLRSAAEKDLRVRLIKLGQFMHFLEDWESHEGYGLRMGPHAIPTEGATRIHWATVRQKTCEWCSRR